MQNFPNQNFKNAKREWNSPLNIFLSFVLVVSLLLSFVNITGAWFTDDSSTGKTISAIIKTGEANLNVYQEDSTGTQTMLSKSLPTGYTQLEYLQSDGNQKFDTGIKPSSNMRFVGKSYFQRTTTGADNYLFGSGSSYSNFVGLMATRGNFWAGVGSASASIVDDFPTIEDYYTFNFDYSYNETTATLNSNLGNGTLTYSDSTLTTANIYLFDRSTAGGTWLTRFYSFTIYSKNVMVRNFVPAKNASGVVGMYDLVEGKFYTNQGTGTFTAGSAQKSGSGISLAYDTTNKTNNKVDVENTNSLKLLLKNEDLGSSFGVRYKVTFYAATANDKVELSSSISGMSVPTSSSNGFVFNSTDGYYYYQNSAGTNVVFEPATSSGATSKYLMTGFSINYTNAISTLLGGNAIYMEISIESVSVS